MGTGDRVDEATSRRGQTMLLWDGVFSRLMDALTGGVFLVGLALFVGASTFMLSVIAALPFLAQAAQLAAVVLLSRIRDRRRVVLIGAGASRSFLLVVGALLLYVPDRLTPNVLVALLGLSALFAVMATSAWNWWIRDLIPRAELGRYFGLRLRVTTILAAVAVPVVGYSLDRFEGVGRAADGYAALFLLGGLMGFVSLDLLRRTPHPWPAPSRATRNPVRALVAPLRSAANRRLAFALMLVASSLTIALPFTAVFMRRSLDYEFFPISILVLVSQVAYVGSLRGWGHLSDRHGNRPVLLMSLGILATSLGGWTVAGWTGPTFATYGLLVVLHFLSGYAIGGIELTANNILLKTAPDVDAPAYLASLSLSRAAAAGIATLAAGLVWQSMGSGVLFSFSPLGLVDLSVRGFHFLAAGSVVVAVLGILALRKIEEPGGIPVADVAVAMRREVRMLSSVAGIRAFVHAVSFVVEFVARPPAPSRPAALGRHEAAPDRVSEDSEPDAGPPNLGRGPGTP